MSQGRTGEIAKGITEDGSGAPVYAFGVVGGTDCR